MAIARGSGTEIIRTILHEDVDNSPNAWLIIGEQHHIYTILSITAFAVAIDTGGGTNNTFNIAINGWDSLTGTSNERIFIARQVLALNETFVWNDKFSFNGYEGTTHSGQFGAGDAAADLAYQNYIADQGGSVAQYLDVWCEHANFKVDVTCTYIDQNNS